jgi:hypothetical protein
MAARWRLLSSTFTSGPSVIPPDPSLPSVLSHLQKIVPNVTEQEATQMIPSTWRWIAAVYVGMSSSIPEDMTDIAWPLTYTSLMVIACNTTGKCPHPSRLITEASLTYPAVVYDVTYTSTGGIINSFTAQKSNATVAGIPILSSLDYFGIREKLKDGLLQMVNPPVSLESWILKCELAMSMLFATPMTAYTVPADSLLVQTRAQKIMTRVPVAAVWLLVLANLFFAALGIGLAIMAWRTADQDVHQVRTRLSVAGLAAALFERNSENRIVKSDKELFQENDKDGLPLVLVGV